MAAFLSVSHREKQFCALSVLFIFVLALVRSVSAQSECSLSKTNKNCTLTIDRSNPVAPSTVQMYSDQYLTVVIKNPLPFERYFLDFSSGQATIAPDVTANIVTALSGNLGKFGNFIQSHEYGLAVEKAKARSANALDDCYAKNFTDKKWPATGDVLTEQHQFNTCFGALAGYAIPTYHDLEPMVAPDALTSAPLTSRTIAYLTTQADVQGRINTYLAAETAISNSITALTKLSGATTPSPYTPDEQLYIAELGVYQKIIDAVSADLAGYEQRIKDIGPCGYVDPNSGPSHNPYCWDKTSQTYSQGNLALWKDKFYLRTGNKACTSSGAAPPCDDPDEAPTVWKPVTANDIKFVGDFDKVKSYQAGNQASYSKVWWSCVGSCVPSSEPSAPAWVNSAVGQDQSLPPITIQSRTDDQRVYQNMVTRTITYSLDTLNLVSYSQEAAATSTNKKALATVAINFADEPTRKFLVGRPTALRLEASAGVFFSWLPSRTFTLTAPAHGCGSAIASGSSTGSGSTTPTVYDCTSRPTPVPFAAANYRVTGDLGGKWKQNLYLTAAVGVNPINTTAEFGVGPSYSWRAFMVSAFAHIGHDTSWLDTTPNSNGNLPTYTHWTVKGAIGISVRVPSLTSR